MEPSITELVTESTGEQDCGQVAISGTGNTQLLLTAYVALLQLIAAQFSPVVSVSLWFWGLQEWVLLFDCGLRGLAKIFMTLCREGQNAAQNFRIGSMTCESSRNP